MHLNNEEKRIFIMKNANFCYKVMPFGLENIRATYQWLMNKVFFEQIGQNIEVYVNDMVVETPKDRNHYQPGRDLQANLETQYEA